MTITLEKPMLPRDYRPLISQLLQNMIDGYGGADMVTRYFNDAPSLYSYSVYLPKCVFKGNIELSSGYIKVIFSTFHDTCYDAFYAAAQQMLNVDMPLADNVFCITTLLPIVEKTIESNTVKVRMLSPLVVRETAQEEGARSYTCLGVHDPDFESQLRHSVFRMLTAASLECGDLETLTVTPYEDEYTCKETHILHRGRFYKTTLGMLRITGEPRLLNLLYQGGIGEMRMEGFGLFELA